MNPAPGCPFHAATEAVLEICERHFQRPRPDGSRPRQFHDKTHACLRGEFQVHPPAEPALRHGLFAEAGRYPALARFSSASFANDRCPDARGLAIKLQGVTGAVGDGAPPGQHDFLLLDQPVAPARTLAEAAILFKLIDGFEKLTPARLFPLAYVLPGLNPWRVRWHCFTLALHAVWQGLTGKSLTCLTYHSVTPYRLGEGAAKYQCRPDARPRDYRKATGNTFLEKLQATLDQGPVGFDFYLQPRWLESDPIDDAGKIWKSPCFRVGHLHLPRQAAAPTVELGDRLAFNPWNCLCAHEPLGSLNELRRHAYRRSSANRNGDSVFPC